uniref:AAA family ATPase n=1 Tax=uncultured Treponema sp. TaxID=162155 RepID=UPI0025F0BB0C
DEYAWYSKYGNTREEVFENIKSNIIKIANAARSGNYSEIDEIDLGDTFKWKIAFMYSQKKLINWFKKEILLKFAEFYGKTIRKNTPISELQLILIEEKGDENLWDFSKQLLSIWNEMQNQNTEDNPNTESSVHYWIYSPGENAFKWKEFHEKGIMALGWEELGDLKAYDSREEIKEKLQEQYTDSSCMNSSLATWQFANEMKVGDVIFVKKGMYKVIGRGVVTGDYEFDANRTDYNHIRKVNWTHDGDWKHPGQAVMKTLTDITDYTDYVEKLNALFEIEEAPSEEIRSFKPYDKSNFLSEVFISPEKYETILGLLERKKNIILQGAPGVGKSFAAKRLAYSILEEKNTNQVKVIQFHQNYSYEDFIVGFRPSEDEGKQFEKRYGVFYDFCKKAADDNNNKYFFIIDEINRGNLSKIFGELLLLIENDKRGKEYKIQLLYSKEDFYIPENVYIIGMMNTADRSLAMIDYALRRRFSFVEFEPAFETEGFKQLQGEISNEKYNRLIEEIIDLNKEIAEDVSLGKGFRIGHSYFIPKESSDVNDQWLSDIVNYEILPLLEEYWFDETDKIEKWKHKLQDAIK